MEILIKGLACLPLPFRPQMMPAVVLGLVLPLVSAAVAHPSQDNTPVRYEAQYTKVFFDDIETAVPALAPGFVLGSGGSFTSNSAEVISGNRSIKGIGSGSYTNFLNTDASTIPFSASGNYRVTFSYRVVSTLDQGFQTVFYSPSANRDGYMSPSTYITGSAGQTGTATLAGTLGPYSDYQVFWAVIASGAVVIDDIQITNVTTGVAMASEDAEGTGFGPGPGLILQGGATATSDPTLVLDGKGSIRLNNGQWVATSPATLPLVSNTPYIVEMQYRVLNTGSGDTVLDLWMQPAGSSDSQTIVRMSSALKNVAPSGVFSSGAQTAAGGIYVLYMSAPGPADIVIDDISIYRQDTTQTTTAPASWARLATLPFPRLGRFFGPSSTYVARYAPVERTPLLYSVDLIEKRLAAADVITFQNESVQADNPDYFRRLKQLNPNLVILPGRETAAEPYDFPVSMPDSTIDLYYNFHDLYFQPHNVPNDWVVRMSTGQPVPYLNYPFWTTNVFPFCPLVNGETWQGAVLDSLTGTVFPSGVWDGIALDGLYARVDPQIANTYDPGLFDYDYNRNGIRDETPALANAMTATSAKKLLQDLRSRVGDLQLIMGDSGKWPEPALAPYINGNVFECMNTVWAGVISGSDWIPGVTSDEGLWRTWFDLYRTMQSTARRPAVNGLLGCGARGDVVNPDHSYINPTAADLLQHRFDLGTTLLDDGFYDYQFFGNGMEAPHWFDEYSVDANGNAVEDYTKRGYLGTALTKAQELASAATPFFQDDFESGALLQWQIPSVGVSITHAQNEIIAGAGSLLIDNQNYTTRGNVWANPIALMPPGTYVIKFDWRILETLGKDFWVGVHRNDNYTQIGSYAVRSIMAGESGTVQFPVTVPAGVSAFVSFFVDSGGKVAIDNVVIYSGGAGPWRRDFQNGFVLVNPLNHAHTFSAAELAGRLNRTGIRRIHGTQAPDVNNGQPVTGDLTLGPFDAIILLADHISSAFSPDDFDADGRSDILWRHAGSGDINVWFMNGATVKGDAWLPRVTNQQWQIAGIGDFNGDGAADVLWRYTPTGDMNLWFMSGIAVTSDAWLPCVSDPQWQIAGIGDFNKDGKSDIVWRNTASGDINVWFMNGATVTNDAWLPRVTDQQWQIAGIGDFNGDGGGDIVWRYLPSGDIDVWLMDGTTVTSDAWLPRVADPQWQINAIGDFNGDGNAEIVWRHTVYGDLNIWFMNGVSFVSDGWLPRVADLQWKILGPR